MRGGEYLTAIMSQWIIHNLERLSIDGCQGLDLIQAHGRRLKFLHMDFELQIDTQTVLTSCPSLELLVMSPYSSLQIFHSTITWVDIWTLNQDHQEISKALHDSLPAAFPALRGVRHLHDSWSTLPYLSPMLRDPMYDWGDYEYDFPGISVIYSSGVFIKKDMVYLEDYDEPSDEEDSEAEGEYYANGRQESLYDDTSDPWYMDESSPDDSEGTDDVL